MPDKPVLHGGDHRPGGQDPTPPGAWIYVSATSASAWSSGTNYDRGDTVGDPFYNYICILANGPGVKDKDGKPTTSNPGVASSWPTFWAISEPVFQNGWDNKGGGLQDLRFRIAVGHYNTLDRQTGNVLIHSDHQAEIQGSVTGGDVTTVIFILPPAYMPQGKLHLSACDDSGSFVSVTVQSSGEVNQGFV